MNTNDLLALGRRIAELRIARQLKQTELAYEAGVSLRTLQRLELGEPVKSDGLIKVIKCLGQWDEVLAALHAEDFSPYDKLAEAGLNVSQLKKQRPAAAPAGKQQAALGESAHKRRVRRSRAVVSVSGKPAARADNTVTVQWPEDQR